MSQKKEKKGEGEDPSSVWLHRNSTYHILSAGAQVSALHHPKNVPLADNSLGAGHWCHSPRVMDVGTGHKFTFLSSSVQEQAQGHLSDSLQNPLPLWRPGTTGATGSWGDVPTVPCSRPSGPLQSRASCRFSSQQEELGLAGAGGKDIIYIWEQIRILDKRWNPEACKSIKQAILTVSLAQVSWLKQESPSRKQGISSCTGNISKALLLLSK